MGHSGNPGHSGPPGDPGPLGPAVCDRIYIIV